MPIARTLGNCLSVANYARLVAALGLARAKKMLLLAENLPAEEALAGGFVSEIVPPEQLDARVAELCGRLVQHAPITMRVTKEAIRRLTQAGLPNGDDLVRQTYGSEDFRSGVARVRREKGTEVAGPLVSRTRSSHDFSASTFANFGSKRDTKIIALLVSLGSEVRFGAS